MTVVVLQSDMKKSPTNCTLVLTTYIIMWRKKTCSELKIFFFFSVETVITPGISVPLCTT